MDKKIFCCMMLWLLAVSASAYSNLQQRVEQILHQHNYDTAGIGIMVVDLEQDSVVISVNADSPMNPASVNKLLTGAAAMELLGPTYTFSTNVYMDGDFNSQNGILKGDLYIQGRGDPGFSAERLWLFVQHLYHRGLREVQGDLVLDNSFFDSVSLGPGYYEGASSFAYLPLISPLAANFSTVAIHHRSGYAEGSPVAVDIFPKIEGVVVRSSARTAPAGTRRNLDVTTSLTAGKTQVDVRGELPLNGTPGYTYRRLWQTWEVFGGALRAMFTESGISVMGQTVEGVVSETIERQGPFYSFTSRRLTDFVDNMFKFSSNFASEMVFKTLSVKNNSVPGSWQGGAQAITQWWHNRELPGAPVMVNGSGMGDENRISASEITALLSYVQQQKSYYPDFLSALSVSNVDGTLADRFRQSRLRGVVRGKTGTLNSLRVSTLAGYILLRDKTYAFAVLCNNVGSGQFDNWVMQERIVDLVAAGTGAW